MQLLAMLAPKCRVPGPSPWLVSPWKRQLMGNTTLLPAMKVYRLHLCHPPCTFSLSMLRMVFVGALSS